MVGSLIYICGKTQGNWSVTLPWMGPVHGNFSSLGQHLNRHSRKGSGASSFPGSPCSEYLNLLYYTNCDYPEHLSDPVSQAMFTTSHACVWLKKNSQAMQMDKLGALNVRNKNWIKKWRCREVFWSPVVTKAHSTDQRKKPYRRTRGQRADEGTKGRMYEVLISTAVAFRIQGSLMQFRLALKVCL